MRSISTRAAAALALLVSLALVTATPSYVAAATPPDGRIAYWDAEAGSVVTVNPDGSAIRVVTPDTEFSFQPDWSPDSSHQVFSSDRVTGNDLRIFTMRRNGTAVRQVTGDAAGYNDFQPTYTKDAAAFIYTRCRPDPPAGCALAFVRADGTGKKLLTPFGHDPADFFADVSPNGKRVAFARFGAHGIIAQVWVMNIDGSHAHPVTAPAPEAAAPTWTPDGKHLLVTSLFSHLKQNVYRMRANGSHLVRLTHSRFPHNAFFADSSPSGSRITYNDDRAYPDLNLADLFVMNADGSNKHAIVSGVGSPQDPSWGTAPLLKGSSFNSTAPAAPKKASASKAVRQRVLRWSAQHKHW